MYELSRSLYLEGKSMAFMLSIQSHIFQKEAEFDKHHYEMGQLMSHDAGSWKILKYGRPITLEVQHG